VFNLVNFSNGEKIIEVGCGVGAQSQILLEKFPNIQLWSIDRAEQQIRKANRYFGQSRFRERVRFQQADVTGLPFETGFFNGAFICWLLEHVEDPITALKEVRRCMKPGAVLFLNEVFNRLAWVEPPSSAISAYFSQYNELQTEIGGDPNIGAKIGYYLQASGFRDIELSIESEYWDSRDLDHREKGVRYWGELLQSARDTLLQKGRITEELWQQVCHDLVTARTTPEGGVFIAWTKARAIA
jgi:ubiquinone/menaquinone biosynthesis C-methylase UbiE